MRQILLDKYHEKFSEIVEEIMEETGNNYEDTSSILCAALLRALTEKGDEIYK